MAKRDARQGSRPTFLRRRTDRRPVAMAATATSRMTRLNAAACDQQPLSEVPSGRSRARPPASRPGSSPGPDVEEPVFAPAPRRDRTARNAEGWVILPILDQHSAHQPAGTADRRRTTVRPSRRTSIGCQRTTPRVSQVRMSRQIASRRFMGKSAGGQGEGSFEIPLRNSAIQQAPLSQRPVRRRTRPRTRRLDIRRTSKHDGPRRSPLPSNQGMLPE